MILLLASMLFTSTHARDLGLAQGLGAFQTTTQTCVTSIFAAGLWDKVNLTITCNGADVFRGESPYRESLPAALSLVTERFAQLGFRTRCQATAVRRPLHSTTTFGSVLCTHQRR